MIEFNKKYWEERGNKKFYYKGEDFYTVTPIPYYYKRREKALELLSKELETIQNSLPNASVLDFGCGDGFYSIFTGRRLKQSSVIGYDIARSMIRRANRKKGANSTENILFSTQFPHNKYFDVIIIFAVFAHLTKKQISYVLSRLIKNLKDEGRIILFEATGDQYYQGTNWHRRTEQEYINILKKSNLILQSKETIIFPFYNKCRYKIIKPVAKLFFKSEILRANNNFLFCKMNELFVFLSKYLDNYFFDFDGNTFFVFSKE